MIVALLSAAVPLLWSLDANLLLLVYDAYVSAVVADGVVAGGGGGDDGHFYRRAFPPGSTPLEGATVWITGASSGIGAELAVQLSHAGAGRLILSGRSRDRLEAVAGSCRAASSERAARASDDETDDRRETLEVSVVPFDLAGGSDVLDDAVSAALRAAGPGGVDVLILNAGRYHCGPALDPTSDGALADLAEVNLAAPIRLARTLLRRDRWRDRRSGRLVAVSSMMGRGPIALNAAYAASKHAVRGYFHSLAAEEPWLRVDVVLPGATDTGLWEGSYGYGHGATGAAPADPGGDATDGPRTPLHADARSKMAVGRCAQLIVSGMIGPHWLFFETWIAKNPGLLFGYLSSYAPMTFEFLARITGALRVALWRKNGEDALYVPTLMRQLWEFVKDYASGRSDRLFP